MAKKFVSIYEVTKHYGGAEEGGWYYPVTEHIKTIPVKNVNKGRKLVERLHNEFSEEYDGIDYKYAMIETKKSLGKEDTTNEPRPYYC